MARAVVNGVTPTALAEMYGFTPAHITRIINSPAFRLEVGQLEESANEKATDVRSDIKKMAKRAIEVLDDQLNKSGIGEKTKQRAAFDILDRAGFGSKPGKFKGGTQINLTKIEKIINQTTPEGLKDDVLDLVSMEVVEEAEPEDD